LGDIVIFVDGSVNCLLVRPLFLSDATFYSLDDIVKLTGARSPAPPLGLTILPNLLPDHWEFTLVDEDIEPLTDETLQWADIVMISGIGSQLKPMVEIIRRAKGFDKIVVVGGSGPTLQPAMYGDADFVVKGEAEDTVPKLLADLRRGERSGMYISNNSADLKQAEVPRYELLKLNKYMFVGVNFCRGCPFACEFCAQIEIFGRKPRTKTADQVVADLQRLYDLGYRGQIDFGYDNLIGDPKAATAVLSAMAEWSKERRYPFYYSTEATVNLAQKPELLSLMRDNDFRMIFVGLETADPEVLKQTKKGQNRIMPPHESVKIFNSYGMVVNTGLILGFDSESPNTAQNILDMVQRTGVFPALVLPLHALPGTGLSRRLHAEERLFGTGQVVLHREDRTDTATTGLNFVTVRPRAEIMSDLVHVLENLYDADQFYDRLRTTLDWYQPSQKHKPGPRQLVEMVRAFLIIAWTTGTARETRRHFWSALFKTLFTQPGALEVVIIQAVLHTNYSNRSKSYIEALVEEIENIHAVGETQYNAQMLPTAAAN